MIDATVAPTNDRRQRRPSPLIDRSVAPLPIDRPQRRPYSVLIDATVAIPL